MTTNKQNKIETYVAYTRDTLLMTHSHMFVVTPTNGTKQVREEENTVYNNAVTVGKEMLTNKNIETKSDYIYLNIT